MHPTSSISEVRLTLYTDVTLTKTHEYFCRLHAMAQRRSSVVDNSAKKLNGIERLVVVQMHLSGGRTLSTPMARRPPEDQCAAFRSAV